MDTTEFDQNDTRNRRTGAKDHNKRKNVREQVERQHAINKRLEQANHIEKDESSDSDDQQKKTYGEDKTKITKLEKISHFEKDQNDLKPKPRGKKSRQVSQFD